MALACALLPVAGDARAQTKGADRASPHADEGAPREPGARSAGSYANALRIARMLKDDAVVAKLLAQQGLAKGASEAELQAVIKANEATGDPEAAVRFLRERSARYPGEKRARVLLAALLSRGGDSARAVAVWRELLAAFGKDALSLDEAHAYARDLSRTGDVDGAYAVLTRLRERAPADAYDYWLDLATLAWEHDDDDIATVAYENVHRLDPKTPHAGARLLALLADAGRNDDVVKLALVEHRRTGDPQPVLFAAQLRAGRGEWAGVRELLDAAEKEASPSAALPLYRSEEFLLLRGDSRKELGDLKGAADAYGRALVVAPGSINVRSKVLWVALDLGEVQRVRQLAIAWRSASLDQSVMWQPMALSFVKVGMFREALPFFELQLRANPLDGHVLLDVADVLAKGDRHSLAGELRRRAIVQLRADALKALRVRKPTADDLHLSGSAAAVVRERSGNPQGEKWLSAMRASNPRFRGQEEMAIDWYMSTERPEYARRLLDKSAGSRKELRKYRLALAMIDEDRSAVSALLEVPSDVSPEERMHAAVILDNDGAAVRAIGDGLAPGQPVADEPAMRQELTRIYYLHRPNVRATGLYSHVTGLDVFGAQASASHDGLGGRLIYAAGAVEMTDRGRMLALSGPVREADAGVLYRRMNPRGVTEVAGALNYQDKTPVARASFLDQRLLTKRLGLGSEVRVGQRIDETSLLRVAAVRNAASMSLRYDEARWYVSGELEGREDQTRRYEHLAWDVVETGEAGVKIITREPHVSVGVQGQASQRTTRTGLPGSVSALMPPGFEPVLGFPPSFQLASAIVHVSRGDFLERYRPDRAPFPRYDCEAAFGFLFPNTDTALHVLCGASIRAPGGYTSLLAFYNRGLAGVKNNENAEVALSYTVLF